MNRFYRKLHLTSYLKIIIFGSIGILLMGWSMTSQNTGLPKNTPQHFVLHDEWERAAQADSVFSFRNKDTLVEHQMQLLKSEDGNPLLYYADIQTPVCIDGLCKPVFIEMYWNLVGQYAGYGVYPEQLLSKFDHEVFESADYLKLHQLLLDRNSVLDRRVLSDLYVVGSEREKAITFKGVEVDGISGATKKEIKSSVVEGALYSCYTLWHLVYGEAAQKIREQLPLIYSESLERYFLYADQKDYQMYALKQMSEDSYEKNIDQVIAIVENGNPLIRSYVLKKWPKHLYAHPAVITQLYQNFTSLDLNSKTLLIKNLDFSNQDAAVLLSQHLPAMSKNQLILYLEYLLESSISNLEFIQKQMRLFAEDPGQVNAYLVKDFLGE